MLWDEARTLISLDDEGKAPVSHQPTMIKLGTYCINPPDEADMDRDITSKDGPKAHGENPAMRHKVRVTVLDKKLYPELQ